MEKRKARLLVVEGKVVDLDFYRKNNEQIQKTKKDLLAIVNTCEVLATKANEIAELLTTTTDLNSKYWQTIVWDLHFNASQIYELTSSLEVKRDDESEDEYLKNNDYE